MNLLSTTNQSFISIFSSVHWSPCSLCLHKIANIKEKLAAALEKNSHHKVNYLDISNVI